MAESKMASSTITSSRAMCRSLKDLRWIKPCSKTTKIKVLSNRTPTLRAKGNQSTESKRRFESRLEEAATAYTDSKQKLIQTQRRLLSTKLKI